MSEDNTRKLEEVLGSVGKEIDAEEFADSHESRFKYFYEFFNNYIAENGLSITEIITRSRISKNYVYNITNGNKKNPGRDKVIALSAAAGMSVELVNRALRISGLNALYPKNKRDVFIAECINRDIRDIIDLNLALDKKGESPLDV